MGRTPIPTEQYEELSQHQHAVHHVNRLKKHQASGKKLRLEYRHRGVPKCPQCHNVVPRCTC